VVSLPPGQGNLTKTPEQKPLRCFSIRDRRLETAVLDGFWHLDKLALSTIFPENPSSAPDQVRGMFFRIVPGETQKAPSRIAPTKTNAAHTASTLSFIVTSTRRTSITVMPIESLAENGAFQKRVDCCSAADFCARHTSQRGFANIMRFANNFAPTKKFRM
jgi:hypothetical protein